VLSPHSILKHATLISWLQKQPASKKWFQTDLWDTEEYHVMATRPKLTEALVWQGTFAKALWERELIQEGNGTPWTQIALQS